MKVLVTGGAGFLGSHLCDSLVKNSKKVYCLDNCSSGSLNNIDHLLDEDNFRFVGHDVIHEWDSEIGNVDRIYHLASRASPIDFKNYPFQIARTNSLGTLNALEFARKKGARFLLASTSEVYGDPEVHPQTEDYHGNVDNLGPRAPYDIGKSFAEAVTQTAQREYGLDTRIVRIFNTYGPRMRVGDGRVIPNFCRQALQEKPITVYGDGSQTRSFCYVSNLVNGLRRVMDSEKAGGEVMNLGNPHEITIMELAERVKSLTESNSEIVHKPLPPGDPSRRKPDISKIEKLVEWEPEIGLEEGLRKTLSFFSKVLDT